MEQVPCERFFVVPLMDGSEQWFNHYYVMVSVEKIPAHRRPKNDFDVCLHILKVTWEESGWVIWVDVTNQVYADDLVIELNFALLYPDGADVRLIGATGERNPELPRLFRCKSARTRGKRGKR